VSEYVYDACGGQRSRLTFLLYLNDDFDGGCTTFFTAGEQAGVVEAQGVSPRAGSVLCFPHGDGAGSLVRSRVFSAPVGYFPLVSHMHCFDPPPSPAFGPYLSLRWDAGARGLRTAIGAQVHRPHRCPLHNTCSAGRAPVSRRATQA
jgi:hypothetical protein